MFARNSLATLLILVAFLVLIAIAATLYGSNDQKKAELNQNVLWRQARTVTDWGIAYFTGADQKNTSSGENSSVSASSGLEFGTASQNNEISQSSELASPDASSSSWSTVLADLKAAFDRAKDNPEKTNIASNSWSNFISWEKTATGADLIFKSKEEEGYRLSLPFKFLAK